MLLHAPCGHTIGMQNFPGPRGTVPSHICIQHIYRCDVSNIQVTSYGFVRMLDGFDITSGPRVQPNFVMPAVQATSMVW